MKHRIGAWLAILTMTLNASGPLIVDAQPTSIPTEICSAGGAKTIASARVGHDLPAQPAHNHRLSSYCSFCVGAAHAAPLAPAFAGFALDPEPDTLLFAPADDITWKSAPYLSARSRGPPASRF